MLNRWLRPDWLADHSLAQLSGFLFLSSVNFYFALSALGKRVVTFLDAFLVADEDVSIRCLLFISAAAHSFVGLLVKKDEIAADVDVDRVIGRVVVEFSQGFAFLDATLIVPLTSVSSLLPLTFAFVRLLIELFQASGRFVALLRDPSYQLLSRVVTRL